MKNFSDFTNENLGVFAYGGFGNVLWWYYNPDSASGGQICELHTDLEHVHETSKSGGASDPARFFECLEEGCRVLLFDVGTDRYDYTMKFIEENWNHLIVGETAETMKKLIMASDTMLSTVKAMKKAGYE